MRDIERCRTAELGGHVDVCDHCGHASDPSYNSCRNRHCPKCQSLAQKLWIEERAARILPTHYFHVVFTLPAELRALARVNPKTIFTLLFETAARTLLDLGRDEQRLGAELGITAVLHTWTRDLRFHPHVHCVVTGGGLDPSGERWITVKPGFLFPVKVMSALFRGKFLAALDRAYRHGELRFGTTSCAALADPRRFARLRDSLYRRDWVVYSKRPFGGAQHVYEYLGRYTHRVAISNQRLLAIGDDAIRFATKNGMTETLTPALFIRRFLQHVLPARFVKIRHYGLKASRNATSRLEVARRLLEAQHGDAHAIVDTAPDDPEPDDELRPGAPCPRCKTGTIVRHYLRPGEDVAALLAAMAIDTS